MQLRQTVNEAGERRQVLPTIRETDQMVEQEHTTARSTFPVVYTDNSVLVLKQSSFIIVSTLAVNTGMALVSFFVARYFALNGFPNQRVEFIYNVSWWISSFLFLVGTGYFIGRFAKPRARLIGIIASCLLFSIGMNAYHIWTVSQLDPGALHLFSGAAYWLRKLFFLITGIVTQIAVAEFFARRYKTLANSDSAP